MSGQSPAELAERLAALRARVDRVVWSSGSTVAGPSVGQLVAAAADELERRERDRARGKFAAAAAARTCAWCGVQWSTVRTTTGSEPRWWECEHGAECAWCRHHRRLPAGYRDDDTWRHLAAHDALGDLAAGWVQPWLAERVAWRWWWQTGAAGGGLRRWAHVDRAAAAAALAPAAADTVAGEPCPDCGGRRWVPVDGSSTPEYVSPRYPAVLLAAGHRCAGCGHDTRHRYI